jgi:hypothetical protein
MREKGEWFLDASGLLLKLHKGNKKKQNINRRSAQRMALTTEHSFGASTKALP